MNEILNAVLQVGAGVVLLLGGWGITRLSKWLGVKSASEVLAQQSERLKQDQIVRDYLLPIVDIATNAAKQRLALALAGAPPDQVQALKREVIQEAATYVAGKASGALEHFGIDDTGMREMVQKRLEILIAPLLAPAPAAS